MSAAAEKKAMRDAAAKRKKKTAYHAAWCAHNREHVRAYNRDWMRARRAKEKARMAVG
jgi:hypothetical protein